MSPEQQKQIVTDLCNDIRDKVLKSIDECEIPEDWDGLELRQLLAELFWEERTIRGRHGHIHPSSERARSFRNLRLFQYSL